MLLHIFLFDPLDIPVRTGKYYDLCVIDEKTDTETLSDLSKITQVLD